MTTFPISSNTSLFNTCSVITLSKKSICFLPPISSTYSNSTRKMTTFHAKLRDFDCGCSILRVGREKDGKRRRNKRRIVVVRVNQFGGGEGGSDNSNNARILGNLALAIGLTYLTMTNQLGWILDAIVSIWLLAVILPIAGLGAFLWWAGRNIVQGSCPNCGKDFQIFRSSLKDGLQLCPYCTQPFSVEGDEFVRESATFTSDQSTTYGDIFSGFSSRSKKGKASSLSVVDIEAEVKDVE
ncbi:U3 small nucleolar rna-associated protein 14 b isoform [Thalictrum thalictroides]|uniref:U3 small nucleolar rna-associated protein 14 b isoform n=1 Tax=Thalictrum thalictroides TaxID=46969 RepID=A0A7J6VW53_THATH|nr:U3 small nucleolar rna-associated protein 14 b isoform [Thalictrum thalictroides]